MSGSPFVDPEVLRFLALRLIGKAGDNGVSSDALVAFSAVGEAVPEDIWPRDLGDFGRCCEAFRLAPHRLQLAMLPTLTTWAQELDRRKGWWWSHEEKSWVADECGAPFASRSCETETPDKKCWCRR